ncbi:MAG: Flp pilus assembly protein CpaB [candidate division Zixibacteria bacterium]|nr:Flp pilus assembly protein CpaB [candidate division Zixibacteria bacterium]
MRSRSIIVIGFVAFVCAAAATAMVVLYLQRTARLAAAGPLLTPVVVSSADLSFGQTLDASKLKIAMFPRESVPKGAVSVIDSLIGQTTKVFLAQNEPVLVSKLSSIGGGLSLMIAPTLRAVSIKVDKVSGVSGFVIPGDRVDVIAIVDQSTSSHEALAKMILQNIEVLAAGAQTEKKGNEPITVQSVTLLVDVPSAEKLALAQSEGKLHLALRNPNDTELAEETPGLTTKKLLSGPEDEKPPPQRTVTVSKPGPKPEPPKQVVKQDTLTIFRGTDAKKEKPAMDAKPAAKDTLGKPAMHDTLTKPPGE